MTETPAIDAALADIAELERDGYITAQLAQRGRDVVGLLFQPSTVYASIAPIDAGDLSFYWVAGDRSITIDLYADGSGWYRRRRGDQKRTEEGGTPKWMYDALAQFSEFVEQANPAWRNQRTVP